MLFSSNVFVYIFLPLTMLIYLSSPQRYRNLVLLVFSLIFYAYDSIPHLWILVAVTLFNYFYARLCLNGQSKKGHMLAFGVIANLSVLFYYKYAAFFASVFMDFMSILSLPVSKVSIDIEMPIGISFFTFHAISYLIDVYKKKVPASTNIVDFSMYFVMFPHLIAGPIVRYSEIASSIAQRVISANSLYYGLVRFCLGLGKKILMADQLAIISQKIFTLNTLHELNTPLAWLGIFCYTFQIYYDFSGYTDMGIGLAQMFGFVFPENFKQPYRSYNVTEFWRTWHMTLGRWFKDYLYIAIGGNRGSLARTCINLLVVFFLCGLWHGASYTFIVWGIYYGILLSLERVLRIRYHYVINNHVGVIVTFLLVMVGWVFFSQPTIEQAVQYLKVLFIFDGSAKYYSLTYFLTYDKVAIVCASVFFAFYNFDFFYEETANTTSLLACKSFFALIVLVLSCANMALYGFKPFIYFQF